MACMLEITILLDGQRVGLREQCGDATEANNKMVSVRQTIEATEAGAFCTLSNVGEKKMHFPISRYVGMTADVWELG